MWTAFPLFESFEYTRPDIGIHSKSKGGLLTVRRDPSTKYQVILTTLGPVSAYTKPIWLGSFDRGEDAGSMAS